MSLVIFDNVNSEYSPTSSFAATAHVHLVSVRTVGLLDHEGDGVRRPLQFCPFWTASPNSCRLEFRSSTPDLGMDRELGQMWQVLLDGLGKVIGGDQTTSGWRLCGRRRASGLL
jgi:hypothetical protein